MSDYNLPHGCSVSDLPGHRPEDIAAEKAAEELATALDAALKTACEGDALDLASVCDVLRKIADEWFGDAYVRADLAEGLVEALRAAQHFMRNAGADMERDYPSIDAALTAYEEICK